MLGSEPVKFLTKAKLLTTIVWLNRVKNPEETDSDHQKMFGPSSSHKNESLKPIFNDWIEILAYLTIFLWIFNKTAVLTKKFATIYVNFNVSESFSFYYSIIIFKDYIWFLQLQVHLCWVIFTEEVFLILADQAPPYFLQTKIHLHHKHNFSHLLSTGQNRIYFAWKPDKLIEQLLFLLLIK